VFNREATTQDRVDAAMAGPVITGAGQSMLFTMVGATGLVLSGFLEWIRPEGVRGIEINYRALYQTDFTTGATFFRSAGAVAIAIGLLAVLGLASSSGWITRLAGALGIITFALFTITLYRMNIDVPTSLGAGPWFMLGGGIVAMFGGFFVTRPKRVVITNS
jgi:hypothetical protein